MNYQNSFYQPLKNLSFAAMIGLALMALCSALSLLVGVAQIADSRRTLELEPGDSTSLWLLLQGLVALVQIPVYVFTIVFFLVWLHRAYKNLPPLRASSTEFTPGWAVGWWFIPFANLVKPFQAVRDLWLESEPEVQLERGFLSPAGGGAPGFIIFWWAMWIASNIFSNIAGKVYDPERIETTEASGYLFIIAAILSITAAGLAITLVRDITGRQALRFANLDSLRVEGPPPPPIFDKDL